MRRAGHGVAKPDHVVHRHIFNRMYGSVLVEKPCIQHYDTSRLDQIEFAILHANPGGKLDVIVAIFPWCFCTHLTVVSIDASMAAFAVVPRRR
jgi:hypothetical protein